ncbi:hypothetical protein A2767_00140 [Candidatus Roizmanbacteria bacterium RIFCSPHIGHO2_01_FULL_35_10]|uniref:Uncharacterized protein n=1 Tax=Candidatus Roizmanbacteria bacterium RIFCSPLOWO2_01_FULL_35_13 TaxID=1802055 RepID=A0A1F7IHB4_9BACT|nr:MAG: hypothetical protein A2767_00140 [Candidatus Roizmanbacteria bacterium RIFCSPHIGHO2_01_FULL_35_10]OGK42760.1 MAG: hypothetical protein A3A74_00920 [Candidatus Roizmanbacteria bacterium RIFCSPLOWO2_01_FULL_35_13]
MFKSYFTRNGALAAGMISFLLVIISKLTNIGIPYNIALVFVFLIFDFAILKFIQIRAVQAYGDNRAVKIFVYGMGAVLLLFLILKLFGVN